ncbi:MAG: hypothetical protein SGPRY_004185 [Prymnesium sp.]
MLSSTHFVRSAPALNESPRLLACKYASSEGFTSTADMDFTSRDALTALFISPSASILQDKFGKWYTVAGVSSSEVGASDTANISVDLVDLMATICSATFPSTLFSLQTLPTLPALWSSIHGRLLLLKQADCPSGEFKDYNDRGSVLRRIRRAP